MTKPFVPLMRFRRRSEVEPSRRSGEVSSRNVPSGLGQQQHSSATAGTPSGRARASSPRGRSGSPAAGGNISHRGGVASASSGNVSHRANAPAASRTTARGAVPSPSGALRRKGKRRSDTPKAGRGRKEVEAQSQPEALKPQSLPPDPASLAAAVVIQRHAREALALARQRRAEAERQAAELSAAIRLQCFARVCAAVRTRNEYWIEHYEIQRRLSACRLQLALRAHWAQQQAQAQLQLLREYDTLIEEIRRSTARRHAAAHVLQRRARHRRQRKRGKSKVFRLINFATHLHARGSSEPRTGGPPPARASTEPWPSLLLADTAVCLRPCSPYTLIGTAFEQAIDGGRERASQPLRRELCWAGGAPPARGGGAWRLSEIWDA